MVPAPAAEDIETRAKSAGGAIARNAAHLVLGQVVTTLLAVVLSAALGRALGASDFGLFFLVTSMAQFAFVVVEWGQLQFVVREVAKDASRAGLLLGSTLFLRVAGTLLLTGLVALTTRILGYDLRTTGLASLLMLCMLPFVLAQAFALVFRGRERMEYESLVSIVNKAITLGLTLVALGLGWGLPGAFFAQGAAGVIALVLAASFLRKLHLGSLRLSRSGIVLILAGGAPLVAMSVAVASQSYIEAVVLSKLGSAESIGWFGAAKVILGTLVAPATILASSAFPRLSRAAHDRSLFRLELQVAFRPLLGLAALGAVGTYLFAGDAVALIYGEDSFGQAATILQVFAPGLLLLFLDILLGTAVVAVGRPVPLAIGKVITLVANALLGILLVPLFQERFGNGGLGVALAFGVCELIMFIAAIVILPRGTIPFSVIPTAGRALLTGGLTLAIFSVLPQPPLIPGVILCVAIFAAFAALTGLVDKAEIRWLGSRLGQMVNGQRE